MLLKHEKEENLTTGQLMPTNWIFYSSSYSLELRPLSNKGFQISTDDHFLQSTSEDYHIFQQLP